METELSGRALNWHVQGRPPPPPPQKDSYNKVGRVWKWTLWAIYKEGRRRRRNMNGGGLVQGWRADLWGIGYVWMWSKYSVYMLSMYGIPRINIFLKWDCEDTQCKWQQDFKEERVKKWLVSVGCWSCYWGINSGPHAYTMSIHAYNHCDVFSFDQVVSIQGKKW